MARRIEEIWIHCSASTWGCAEVFRQWHRARGWRDVGYHFVILNGRPYAGVTRWPFLDGAIEPGRPLDDDPIFEAHEVGAHVAGRNARSIGICLVGDDRFTDRQLLSLRSLVRELGGHFGVPVPQRVYGHYEDPNTSKTCPNIPMDELRASLVLEGPKVWLPTLQESIRDHNAALRGRR